jgi:DNA-binding CsgD family transcriptional regulator
LWGNIGYLNYLSKRYDSAVTYLNKEISYYLEKSHGAGSNVVNSLVLWADIALARNDNKAALAYALRAYEMSIENVEPDNYEVRKSLYATLGHAYGANGNLALAYAFTDSASAAKDTLARRVSALISSGAQHKIEAEKRLFEQKQLEQRDQLNTLLRNALIVGLVLVVVITILLVNRMRIKASHTQKILEAQKLQAEMELMNATAQLKTFTQSISEKNELIEKISSEMALLQKAGPGFDNSALTKLQRSRILTDVEWSEFQQMFEKAHPGYINRLLQNVQGLSPVEMRFILLSKLKMSGKEMSGVLGISQDAVRQNKERLCNKLRLRDRTLESFSNSI